MEDPGVSLLRGGSLPGGEEVGFEDPGCWVLVYGSLRGGVKASLGCGRREYTAGWRSCRQGLQERLLVLMKGVRILGLVVCDRVAVVECGSGR